MLMITQLHFVINDNNLSSYFYCYFVWFTALHKLRPVMCQKCDAAPSKRKWRTTQQKENHICVHSASTQTGLRLIFGITGYVYTVNLCHEFIPILQIRPKLFRFLAINIW